MTTPTDNLERIAKLLHQAENTEGAESEAFMEAAQRLAALYSVDLNKARMTTLEKERYSTPAVKFLQVGERGKKGLRTLQALAAGIAEANDLRVTYRNDGTGITMYGFPEDIQVTEAMYASLLVQMVDASERYLATGQYMLERVRSPERKVWRNAEGKIISAAEARYDWDAQEDWVGGDYKPMSKLTARLDFQQGFADKVESRLKKAKREAEQELLLQDHLARVTDENGDLSEEFKIWYFERYSVDLEENTRQADLILQGGGSQDGKRFIEYMNGDVSQSSPGTELVLADKKQQVDEFYIRTSNVRGLWKGYGGGGSVASGAGAKAGENARLSGQGSLPGARKALK